MWFQVVVSAAAELPLPAAGTFIFHSLQYSKFLQYQFNDNFPHYWSYNHRQGNRHTRLQLESAVCSLLILHSDQFYHASLLKDLYKKNKQKHNACQ